MKKNHNKAFTLTELSIVILIIGLVVVGVSKATGMYDDYNLKTARSLSRSSPVPLYSGLVLWLDATAENSITNTSDSLKVENNDTVKTWIDQNPQVDAGSRFTFTQKASGEGPTYVEKGINGLPSLYFDYVAGGTPTGDGLYTAFSPILNTQQFTFFVVTMPVENTADWEALIISRENSTSPNLNKGFNLYKKNNSSNFNFWWGDGSAWNQAIDSSTFSFNVAYISEGIRSGSASSGDSTLYRNGTQTGAGTSTAFVPNNNPNGAKVEFCIGYHPGTNSTSETYYYDGYISEIILYNRALKDIERKAVEKYLSQKYKINLS